MKAGKNLVSERSEALFCFWGEEKFFEENLKKVLINYPVGYII
nr:MAG TPA: Peptide methionine sulfoxide reductase [Caudoviricetes sp.]